ncbi:MAG: peptidase-C39 like family protein, partial [Legionella sp.]
MIDIKIYEQPDDETCGPTSLHAVYNYFGHQIPLEDIIRDVERSESGGTLAALLGNHALKQGFKTTIYIYNLNIFDPTWFPKGLAENEFLIEKLEAQYLFKNNPLIKQESLAYISYLKLGGQISFQSLNVDLLKKYFNRNIPILTALSATYLYRSAREYYVDGHSFLDDVKGTPCGHFVVLCGYDDNHHLVVVADPHPSNPLHASNYYKVGINRLINSIMLGVLTYDANLLIIEPKE